MPTGVFIRTKEYREKMSSIPTIGFYEWNKNWTPEEEKIMENYSNLTAQELLILLPNRNHQNILNFAHRKGMKKSKDIIKKQISVYHRGKSFNVGEKNYNWKGGVTPEQNKVRSSIEYKLWSQSVLARDGWICQKTGARGGNLTAHHILNFSSHPKLRFAIDNGITLSHKAHIEFHKKYGKMNNTREQLLDFITQA